MQDRRLPLAFQIKSKHWCQTKTNTYPTHVQGYTHHHSMPGTSQSTKAPSAPKQPPSPARSKKLPSPAKSIPSAKPAPARAPSPSLLHAQLTHYFVNYLRARINPTKALLQSTQLQELIEQRVALLQRPREEWGGGGGYEDISEVPRLRLDRLAEEVVECLRAR